MADTMKALAKTKPGVGLELIDAPIPVAGDEDVLIRVHRTAVCGTDIHIWNWDAWAARTVPTPLVTGHEFAAYGTSPIGTVRDAWNEAFEVLDSLIPGGMSAVPVPDPYGSPPDAEV